MIRRASAIGSRHVGVSCTLARVSPVFTSISCRPHFSSSRPLLWSSRPQPPRPDPQPVRYQPHPNNKFETVVERLNEAIEHYPIELIASVGLLESANMFLVKGILQAGGFSFQPAIIIAFGGTWIIRKFFPVKLFCALPLSRVFLFILPGLRLIEFGRIFSSPDFLFLREGARLASKNTKNFLSPVTTPIMGVVNGIRWEFVERRRPGIFARLFSYTASLAEKSRAWAARSGAALLLGYRLSGSIIVLTAYFYLISLPSDELVPESPELSRSSLSAFLLTQARSNWEKIRTRVEGGGIYVGAFVLSGFLFPLALAGSPFLARGLHRFRNRFPLLIPRK